MKRKGEKMEGVGNKLLAPSQTFQDLAQLRAFFIVICY